jgi:hypothetical protein
VSVLSISLKALESGEDVADGGVEREVEQRHPLRFANL